MRHVNILNVALKEVGTAEVPLGSNKVKYNEWYYGNKSTTGAWCMVFVCWCLNQLGLLSKIGGKYCQCLVFEAYALAHMQVVPVREAMPGDIVTFGGTQFSKVDPYRAHHVGIVRGVDGNGGLYTVEGNASDKVDERHRTSGIRYVFRVDIKEDDVMQFCLLGRGSKGTQVKLLQILLNHYINAGLEVDGVFGTATDKAVKRYQELNKLDVDGEVGSCTWSSLIGEGISCG